MLYGNVHSSIHCSNTIQTNQKKEMQIFSRYIYILKSVLHLVDLIQHQLMIYQKNQQCNQFKQFLTLARERRVIILKKSIHNFTNGKNFIHNFLFLISPIRTYYTVPYGYHNIILPGMNLLYLMHVRTNLQKCIERILAF